MRSEFWCNDRWLYQATAEQTSNLVMLYHLNTTSKAETKASGDTFTKARFGLEVSATAATVTPDGETSVELKVEASKEDFEGLSDDENKKNKEIWVRIPRYVSENVTFVHDGSKFHIETIPPIWQPIVFVVAIVVFA
eukprot:CAMPEP_0168535298 /NCGR_PEP_ID=MMETSP0405-20121227/18567_1 /TAXON_ID=498012 /ORGANISM="Trichosphaerium sp, Strain Am-I-7 wt" /LENGTH=136 /DNA_ID=CAMNT_0008562479 /DNA_START=494 /DNA_END=901 /DNA_ORIENTATION=-